MSIQECNLPDDSSWLLKYSERNVELECWPPARRVAPTPRREAGSERIMQSYKKRLSVAFP